MSLLPFVGPGQDVELREVRRKIVERSEAKQKRKQMKALNRENKDDVTLPQTFQIASLRQTVVVASAS